MLREFVTEAQAERTAAVQEALARASAFRSTGVGLGRSGGASMPLPAVNHVPPPMHEAHPTHQGARGPPVSQPAPGSPPQLHGAAPTVPDFQLPAWGQYSSVSDADGAHAAASSASFGPSPALSPSQLVPASVVAASAAAAARVAAKRSSSPLLRGQSRSPSPRRASVASPTPAAPASARGDSAGDARDRSRSPAARSSSPVASKGRDSPRRSLSPTHRARQRWRRATVAVSSSVAFRRGGMNRSPAASDHGASPSRKVSDGDGGESPSSSRSKARAWKDLGPDSPSEAKVDVKTRCVRGLHVSGVRAWGDGVLCGCGMQAPVCHTSTQQCGIRGQRCQHRKWRVKICENHRRPEAEILGEEE